MTARHYAKISLRHDTIDNNGKHKVFGFIVRDLDKTPIGHKLNFARKPDASGNIIRYKVRFVAQGFSQRPGVDFNQTYSPVINTISFRFLLALTIQLSLHIYLLDVVTTYLHGVLDTKLFIVPPLDSYIMYLQPNQVSTQTYR